MKYCANCLYPTTKPDLAFNSEGICSACSHFEQRVKINWAKREQEFRELCTKLIKEGHQYHCIVPVSGGKDSHYQILKVKEYGLNPLGVCAHTDHLSIIGRRNLENIAQLGVDLLEVNTDRKTRAKINAFTLREIGDISWAEHITIFSIPVRIAARFNVPLIVWGENPQAEYGGPTEQSQQARVLDKRWLSEYGGLLGLRCSDLIDAGIATKEQLYLYLYPDLTDTNIKGLFLGQYFAWDGAQNALLATKHGFSSFPCVVEGTGYHYENLDNLQTGIHDYFKYIKYGFGRATDMVSNYIRRGTLTRGQGKELVLSCDGAYPSTYLGVALQSILEPLAIGVEEFVQIANKFTNKNLFEILPNRPRPRPLFLEDLKRA